MRDQRWPVWGVLIIRPIQLLFSLIILGMTAYLTSEVSGATDLLWSAPLGLVTALIATIYLVASIVLYFRNRLLPLFVVVLDAFCVLFYLIAMAGTADAGFPKMTCNFSYYDWYLGTSYSGMSTFCHAGKAAFALELLNMFFFIATLVLAALILHKNRKDLRGKKYNAGEFDPSAPTNDDMEIGTVPIEPQPVSDKIPEVAGAYAPPAQPQSAAPEYVQPPHPAVSPVYYPPPGTEYQNLQYQQPQTFYPPPQQHTPVSPIGTPVQQQPPYAPPPPQSPPPVAASEISGQEVYPQQQTQYPLPYPTENAVEMPSQPR
ncbi:hypothetical protein EX30DRAFT_344998 [Ascodesmis nigricans]|uniref:MARVEL domain-containing protein n=1 Tax=Ascodesmis nigricans TaxID=341454 RepID=A0A4S2MPP0_9PEZI|nr:hypothetical protein EX30DRAFT_344998 [Ascodesmis nigricans]